MPRSSRSIEISPAVGAKQASLWRLAHLEWLPVVLAAALSGSALNLAAAPTVWRTAQSSAANATEPQRRDFGSSAMDGELMYLVMLGELQAQAGQPGAGYSLILQAALRSGEPDLFRRAVNMALQSRSGEAALDAAQAWIKARKDDSEPQRYTLQMLLALNRVADSAAPLAKLLDLTPESGRVELINLVGQTYARVSDRSAALQVVQTGLRPWQQRAHTASAAWAAMGLVHLSHGNRNAAVTSVAEALQAPFAATAAGLLAVDLLDASPTVEPLVLGHLEKYPQDTAVSLAYARALLRAQRWKQAERLLQAMTVQHPNLAEAWLMRGALQQQAGDLDAAETSFKRYVQLVEAEQATSAETKGNPQAYLALAQIAESRNQLEEASRWLDRVPDSASVLRVELQRASLLARQSRWDAALEVIRQIPERDPGDERAKLLAEVQLLKDAQRLLVAYDTLAQALALNPNDVDLMYEQATLAERLQRFEEMEHWLRQSIAGSPDFHHAYNALGYSLADRGVRLSEAKDLILKALELAPNDPFITDSLGWVEFRLGRLSEAHSWLRKAFDARPDLEIATHLGEVLWQLGQREEAMRVFRHAQSQPGNQKLLKDTLKRLGVEL